MEDGNEEDVVSLSVEEEDKLLADEVNFVFVRGERKYLRWDFCYKSLWDFYIKSRIWDVPLFWDNNYLYYQFSILVRI